MGKSAKIEKIWAREVLNFRGNPAVEAEVFLTDGSYGKAAVPAGISTGSSEAVRLFDGDPGRFGGKGVLRAVKNVRKVIAPALQGLKADQQEKIDEALLQLDGTPDKSKLGANAILGVSLAAAHAAAASRKISLFRYLGGEGPFRLPVPVYDMLGRRVACPKHRGLSGILSDAGRGPYLPRMRSRLASGFIRPCGKSLRRRAM